MEFLGYTARMLEIASLTEPTVLLIKEYLAFFCSEIVAQIFIAQKFFQAMGKLAPLSIWAMFVLDEVFAQFHFQFGSWLHLHETVFFFLTSLLARGIRIMADLIFFIKDQLGQLLFYIPAGQCLRVSLLSLHRIEIMWIIEITI